MPVDPSTEHPSTEHPSIEHPSIEHGVFEPEATAVMGEAFEAACKELHDLGRQQTVRKVVAERIIEAASRGVLDVVRLQTAAVCGLPPPVRQPIV